MSSPRIGSLCTGYGGLDMAVEAVIPDAELAWVSDIDKGACKVLAHRYPDVPNLGDFTKTDWASVTPVDILTAGFPCQPVSTAGNRRGDLDERWLWDDVARAVGELRPRRVLLENVRGLLTAKSGRLFGRVLGALADLGYDAQWHGLRAAEVGAPHNRFRVFIVATDAQHGKQPLGATRDGGGQPLDSARARAGGGDSAGNPAAGVSLVGRSAGPLLPTPAVNDMGPTQRPTCWHAWTADMQARHGNGNGHGKSLSIEAARSARHWGQYAGAVYRWEGVTRCAPPPADAGPSGQRLAPAFVEWMMGLPAGWVTDVPDLTRNEALKLCGNGVVPQQAEAALRVLLDRIEVAA